MHDPGDERHRLGYAPRSTTGFVVPPVLNRVGLCGAMTAAAVFIPLYLWADYAENVIRIPRLWYQNEEVPMWVGVLVVAVSLAFVRRTFCYAGFLTTAGVVAVYVCDRVARGHFHVGLY